MSIQISPKEYERKLNWDDGKLYCDLLYIDGKNDWRMPTLEEGKIIFSNIMPHNVSYDYYSKRLDDHIWYWVDGEFTDHLSVSRALDIGYLPYDKTHYAGRTDRKILQYVRPVRTLT